MKYFLFLLFLGICCVGLFANPIMEGPALVELYRNGDNWELTLLNIGVWDNTLDNCAISTTTDSVEFNSGIMFPESAETVVSNYDLQDSLYINWEGDEISTYWDAGNGYMMCYQWIFSSDGSWHNSIDPLLNGQSMKVTEPLMDYWFYVKDSNIEGGLRTKGYLEGYAFDIHGDPIENATVKYYRTNSWLMGIFPPTSTNETGFYSSETYAKNYEVSLIMNNVVLIDTFLTVEPDSIISVDFYTNYDPVHSDDHEIELSASFYNLSNFPNPFNPSTEISFQISDFNDQNLEIQIFNTKGQRINTIPVILSAAEQCNEGSVTWNGTNSTGKSCPSGVYFYKLVSGDKELAANKMLLLK
jgi:hypothetical protein